MDKVQSISDKFFIKQFGLQRSGTNAMKALLEINYPNVRVLTNYLGNKHSACTWDSIVESSNSQNYSEFDLLDLEIEKIRELIAREDLPIIIHVKKPIPWFESYFRYQKKKIQFLNPEANPIFDIDWCIKCSKIWEEQIVSWITLANQFPDNCIIIEHKETLLNTENVLANIVNKFNLKKSPNLVSKIDNVMKRGHQKEHGENLINPYHKFDPTYHTENKWLENYPSDVLAFAEQEVRKIIERNEIISQSEINFVDY